MSHKFSHEFQKQKRPWFFHKEQPTKLTSISCFGLLIFHSHLYEIREPKYRLWYKHSTLLENWLFVYIWHYQEPLKYRRYINHHFSSFCIAQGEVLFVIYNDHVKWSLLIARQHIGMLSSWLALYFGTLFLQKYQVGVSVTVLTNFWLAGFLKNFQFSTFWCILITISSCPINESIRCILIFKNLYSLSLRDDSSS